MNYDTRLNNLYTKHENQIKAFERHRADMKKAVHESEQQILQKHSCTYENASDEVWRIINALREDYDRYWSNDGQLLTELMRRQMEEVREALNNLRL